MNHRPAFKVLTRLEALIELVMSQARVIICRCGLFNLWSWRDLVRNSLLGMRDIHERRFAEALIGDFSSV